MSHGARVTHDGARFRLWAPFAARAEVVLHDQGVVKEMSAADRGFHQLALGGVGPGDRYSFRLDGGPERPDPASLSQPEGVHGPSALVDLDFAWNDAGWRGRDLRSQVVYEMHVGCFTPDGTFDSAIDRLDHLVDLGVTTVELMPVAQCPGTRNWGYDGVDLYAVQHSYGGPAGLQRFVDACHRHRLGVWLDVVYNHLGPEGNYLGEFGPYFTDRYRTPWGMAVNLDGRGSDEVRRFFIDNALMWIDDFHIDGLRLDAVHAIFDQSAEPFLGRLAQECHDHAVGLGRPIHVVAENALNDPAYLRSADAGGLGLDAAWNDDFHHALHVALTGETARYYADFVDGVPDLATAIGSGYVAAGRYSQYRGRRHGASSADLPRTSLVAFAQNHDQVGNRGRGERLSNLVEPAALRLAAGLVLLSPWVPMLFMGEEWGEVRPFLYFVDHGDPDLVEAVRHGRSEEFEGFMTGDVPDPASPGTRHRSVLDWEARSKHPHDGLLELHRALIAARSRYPALTDPAPESHVIERVGAVILLRSGNRPATFAVFNVGASPAHITPAQITPAHITPARDGWQRILDGDEPRFGGSRTTLPESVVGHDRLTLNPWAFALYGHEETQ